MTSMYYLNNFGDLTKPPASNLWWQMENIWWLTPPNHLICRALIPTVLHSDSGDQEVEGIDCLEESIQ